MKKDDEPNIILLTDHVPKDKSAGQGNTEKHTGESAKKLAMQSLARPRTAMVLETLENIITTSADDMARVEAIKILLDFAWGKPVQPIHHTHGRPA